MHTAGACSLHAIVKRVVRSSQPTPRGQDRIEVLDAERFVLTSVGVGRQQYILRSEDAELVQDEAVSSVNGSKEKLVVGEFEVASWTKGACGVAFVVRVFQLWLFGQRGAHEELKLDGTQLTEQGQTHRQELTGNLPSLYSSASVSP